MTRDQTFDSRLTPARPDLAAEQLKGQVTADRFVPATPYQISAGVTAIRNAPAPDAGMDTQALFGDIFDVYEEKDGWAWGQARLDGYVGYVDMESLSAPVTPPTHRIRQLRSHVFCEPNLKTAPLALLSMNARVHAEAREGQYVKIARSGWLHERALAPVAEPEPDWVAVAERFLGTPYLWGGRESLGLDCSGLIQSARHAAGYDCPRDTDMQEAALGQLIEPTPDFANLQRGDLVFWKGHVGLMTDAATLVHANAYYMECVTEPLAHAVERIGREYGPVRSVRRV